MLQGKYDEAEPLAREAVAIYRKVHGDEHPFLASGLSTLAELLQEQVSIKMIKFELNSGTP